MKIHFTLLFITLYMINSSAVADVTAPPRERLSLDPGWRFHLGDIPSPVIQGHGSSYNNAKAGNASGAAAAAYDDTGWRVVNLPHDWAVEGPFDPKENLSQGYRPRGISWYRRSFKLDPADRGKHLEIQFDAVATHCTVWINGTVVKHNWCGYNSFYVDLTSFAKFGSELNTVVVKVDANAMEGWWYEGAGIYRHTWLVKRNPVHIITDGVFAHPVREADGTWTLPVEVTVNNIGKETAPIEVESTLLDSSGKQIAQARGEATIKPLDTSVAAASMTVTNPKLWSVNEPTIYGVHTVVKINGTIVDEITTQCGFRTIRFDADLGFFLNDQPLKIKGTCNHIDHAGVGVAVPDTLWEFRLRKLKEMGSNAVRCSHNPPSVEFLDACDRMGVLVMDENRNFNPSPEYMEQLEWMVRRDRNHPSIILWSVFNEEPMQSTEQGYEMVRRMAAALKKLDTTRPVTAAMNSGQFTPLNVADAVDVVGFNYCNGSYDRFHALHPNQPMISSEDTSATMTRGEYVTDKNRNVLAAYDTEHPNWATTHRVAWEAIAKRPFIAGTFVWTGFDYRGEPTPFGWPSAGSFFGCMDSCGFPKTAFFLHQAQWMDDKPVLTLVPHWNWTGSEGKPIKVMALTNVQSVELILNGKSIGERSVDKYGMLYWDVPYEAGKLEAVGKNDGREVSRYAVETTGAPVSVALVPDRTTIKGDGGDALPVTVQTLDAQGRVVPTANNLVEFELSGPGVIVGMGNGDPNCHEAEQGRQHSLFNGFAQVILQSTAGNSGALTLRAKAPGLAAGETTINVVPAPPPVSVPVAKPVLALSKWRMSPSSVTRPDPNQQLADSDQNSWANVQAGGEQKFADGNFAIYRIAFKPFAEQQKEGGQIRFEAITGKAEVWLDGKLVGTKASSEKAGLNISLSPGEPSRNLNVLVEIEQGKAGGLSGTVSVGSMN